MRTRVRVAIALVAAMGSAMACRGRRDEHASRYGPEIPYESVASTLPYGGGPPVAPSSGAASASACTLPTSRPLSPTHLPGTIPPRPLPAQRPHG
jgi:hypothetical protein